MRIALAPFILAVVRSLPSLRGIRGSYAAAGAAASVTCMLGCGSSPASGAEGAEGGADGAATDVSTHTDGAPTGISQDGTAAIDGPELDAGSGADAGAGSDGSVDVGPDAPRDGAADSDGGGLSTPDAQLDAQLDAAVGYGPYGDAGPATVTTTTFSVSSTSGTTFTVTAYIPSTAGAHPAVVLSSGLAQPASAYSPYGERLASWGVVAVLRDDPFYSFSDESATDLATDIAYEVTTWLPTQNTTASSALFGRVDATRLGLAGHSRGGQVSLLAAEGAAKGKIKGFFGLDPVNGTPSAATTLDAIGVPLAFVGETTDEASSGCAPLADDYLTLYGVAASPIVAITAVNADHTMFEEASDCNFCTLCTAGTASQPAVLAYSVRYLTAFFARELLSDSTVGATFEGAGVTLDESAGLVTEVSK